MQNIFKIDAIRALRSVRVTTERLARVMRRDALSRKRDFQQIKELNYRLARVIPIIPGQLGTAGVIFGVGEVASSSGGLFLPPFPPFGGLPPVRQGPGPKRPKEPSRQPTGQEQTQVIKEELEEPQVVTEGEDIRSAEYNRRRQEEAKRKAEEERIKQGVPAKVPAQPGQTPAELEEEAKPERQEPKTTPVEPPFVPAPIKLPDPEKLIEAATQGVFPLEGFTGVAAPPFIIPDVITQTGVPATAPSITIPNFDPNDKKQRDDLKQKIGTYIFKVPNSDFERRLERGVILPDGTLLIKRKGQQIAFSEPLTEEQLGLIRLMGFVNISEWLPVVPIRGGGGRRGTVPGVSRSGRPLIPRTRNQTVKEQRQQLEESFRRPTVPGSGQGTQPALPGASINQPKLPKESTTTVGLEKVGQVIDVPVTQSVTTGQTKGVTEIVGGGVKRRIKKRLNSTQIEQEQIRLNLQQIQEAYNRAPEGSATKREYKKLLDAELNANVIRPDPSSMQGPAQAGSGVREIIQPIIIRTD